MRLNDRTARGTFEFKISSLNAPALNKDRNEVAVRYYLEPNDSPPFMQIITASGEIFDVVDIVQAADPKEGIE